MSDKSWESHWRQLEHIWIKFCGISDECGALEYRWKYLSKSNAWLPDLGETFRRLRITVRKITEDLEKLGFSRRRIERFPGVAEKLRQIGRRDSTLLVGKMNDEFLQLIRYLGLLKIAYFQRTSSSEIPQLESGVAHSLERTIGAETAYRGMDNLARNYVGCTRQGFLRWDGMVTFVYPIQFEQNYFAGSYMSDVSGLYNLQISEEQKYLPFCGIFLAHEVAHPLLRSPHGLASALWATKFDAPFTKYVDRNMEEFMDRSQLWESAAESHSDRCPLFRDYIYQFCTNPDFISYMLRECLADLIAVRIAGVHYATALVDVVPSFGSLFRMTFLAKYHLRSNIENHFRTLQLRLEEQLRPLLENCDWDCMNVFRELAQSGGSMAKELNTTLIEEHLRKGDEPAEALRKLGLRYAKKDITVKRDLLKYVVINPFSNSNRHIEQTKRKLEAGEICPEMEPRVLMHAYYEHFFETNSIPDYSVIIHSLAYNTWKHRRTLRE